MRKYITVQFDKDGIEYRANMPSCYVRLSEIASIVEFGESWTSRLTLKNGRSYLVDGSEDVMSDVRKQRKTIAERADGPDPIVDDLHHFWLVKEERQPKSWLGRIFADAAHLFNGDSEPLPPLRVTHDDKGTKLTREQLRGIYRPDGSLIEPNNPILEP